MSSSSNNTNTHNNHRRRNDYPLKRTIPVPNFLGELWHTPPHWFVTSPYQGAMTFTIVRNPYERYISEYYCPHFGMNHRPGAAAMDRLFHEKFVRLPPRSRSAATKTTLPSTTTNNRQSSDKAHRRLDDEPTKHTLLLNRKKEETPESLNRWLSMRLRGQSTLTAHMMPQYLYVYDLDGNQVIDHVLKYESLSQDFPKLMEHYQLPISLPTKPTTDHPT